MQQKKLYRSAKDKKIFGVAGGLADYFNVDSSLVRVIFVVSAFAGSAGVWIYLILALVLKYSPYYDSPEYEAQRPRLLRSKRGSKVFGVCEAYARYFDLDVTVLRVVMLVLAFLGIGILFYIISGIIIPVEQ